MYFWKIVRSILFSKNFSQESIRPVSLTCVSCKILEHILEHIINRHILDHIDKHILADAQHVFRKRRSCETQLLLNGHDLASVVNDRGQVDMLVVDFAKAYDIVEHRRLLSKVKIKINFPSSNTVFKKNLNYLKKT